ncbi:sensor histidine kinase [Bosea sp. NPDC003192]|uniref:sensor histidine kinase n=1 Tax=Bosea sp. NPDC003192 TaxID=3390551 RepID=UPI003D034623
MLGVDSDKLRFKPRARIIRTIGDQLISGPEAAVIELVKNAYDADASNVTITFTPPLDAGVGRITVQDDGHGMALSDIQEKWMEPATTSKQTNRRSPSRQRVMMGSKGIGRFAAAKLGARMALNSITRQANSYVEVLIPEINWSDFNGETYLSDIAIDYYVQETESPTGTLIEVLDLNESWPESKVNRLILELRRLLSPLRSGEDGDHFDIYLDISACTIANAGFDGASIATDSGFDSDQGRIHIAPFPLLTSCDYDVSGSFDDLGNFTGTFKNNRAETKDEEVKFEVPLREEEDSCGPVEIRLFVFDREADALKSNMRNAGLGNINVSEARKILDNIAGVAIYRSGFRIRPYGDPENDWLTLDKRRVQNPSLHIGHNQVAGFISVADQHSSNLEERSSREGFEQNGAFRRLVHLIDELLIKVVEPKRYQFRAKAGISRSRGVTFAEVRKLSELEKLRAVITRLAPAERVEAELLIDAQSSLLTGRIDQLEERQRILEAKSSLGAIVSEILHEGAQPAAYIANTAARLKSLYPDLLGANRNLSERAKAEFDKKLPLISESGIKLSGLFRNLKPLAGGRRGPPEVFSLANVITGAVELFKAHQAQIEVINPDKINYLIGYKDDLSTALVNLIANSLHWIEENGNASPHIRVSVEATADDAIVAIEDNGPGINEDYVDLIFDVGFTLKSGGTGLGLNIAREALARSGATLAYDSSFTSGARFKIGFPRVRDKR